MSIYEKIISRRLIDKGWSGDRKYRAVCDDGGVYLLRVASGERAARFPFVFERMKAAEKLGISMCTALEWGESAEGVYAIQRWIDGEDAEKLIPALSEKAQYAYGLSAGQALLRLHTLPAPEGVEPWALRYGAKIDRKLRAYEASPIKYEEDEALLRYIDENRYLIALRPQSYQHGDWHIGNMMVDKNGALVLIDFDKADYGDPWEEFNRIVWSAQAAPAFASGMVDGYFPGGVPEEFWRLLALYISTNILGSLPWAIKFGEEEILTMRRQQADILRWYKNMTDIVPTWYRKEI